MIHWERIGLHNQPPAWDETGEDGVFGDVEALAASCEAGEQGFIYLLRRSEQAGKLAEFRGTSGSDPQAPRELPDIDEELPSEGDVWE